MGALAATPVVGELHERMQRIARAFLVLLLDGAWRCGGPLDLIRECARQRR